ncbi:MAG TPA: RidA family protein, partial [Bacteroidia bacterium]|nr:RidA family protein [Bacteroidia bacterium]
MSVLEDKLNSIGISLAQPKAPVANYLSTKLVGDLLFVSARVSELQGTAGEDVTEAEAKQAARDTVILLLAIVKKDIQDLDQITSVIKLQGFIRSGA